MNSFSVSSIVEQPASGPGALDGFACRCTCGLVMSSSLRSLLEGDAAAHVAWHERQDRAQRKFRAQVERAGL